ncbi:hypothetical protein HDU88_008926 [Geranomyces variabilis]|nr:hypothetical protein HDU88_008926 [Geranomyces variabilis]
MVDHNRAGQSSDSNLVAILQRQHNTPARARFSILGAYLDLRAGTMNNRQIVWEGSGHDQVDFQRACDELRRAAPEEPAPVALQVLNKLRIELVFGKFSTPRHLRHAAYDEACTSGAAAMRRWAHAVGRSRRRLGSGTGIGNPRQPGDLTLVLPVGKARIGVQGADRHDYCIITAETASADQNEEDKEEGEKQTVISLIKAIVSDVWASCRVQTERRHFFLDGAYTKSDIVVTTPASAAALSQPMPYLVAEMARGGDAIHKDFVESRNVIAGLPQELIGDVKTHVLLGRGKLLEFHVLEAHIRDSGLF